MAGDVVKLIMQDHREVERLFDERREQLGEAFVASRKQHLGEQPGDMTRDQLAQQAANADISGTAGLSKDKLEKKVQSQADL